MLFKRVATELFGVEDRGKASIDVLRASIHTRVLRCREDRMIHLDLLLSLICRQQKEHGKTSACGQKEWRASWPVRSFPHRPQAQSGVTPNASILVTTINGWIR